MPVRLGNPVARRPALCLYFEVCDEPCWLELTAVERVLPWASLTPADDPRLLGWLHGTHDPLPVVDAGPLLGGAPTEPHLGARILQLSCGGRPVGVLVCRLFQVLVQGDVAHLERFNPCDVLGSLLDGTR